MNRSGTTYRLLKSNAQSVPCYGVARTFVGASSIKTSNLQRRSLTDTSPKQSLALSCTPVTSSFLTATRFFKPAPYVGQERTRNMSTETKKPTMEAKCNCGAVSVTVTKPGLFDSRNGHICHCINCQKTSGSAYGANLIIETEYVKIEGENNLTTYTDPDSLSGNPVHRSFCKTCGSPIKSETDAATKGGKVVLKLGIFRELPEPEMETFNITRHPWVKPLSGATQFKIARGGETLPTPP